MEDGGRTRGWSLAQRATNLAFSLSDEEPKISCLTVRNLQRILSWLDVPMRHPAAK